MSDPHSFVVKAQDAANLVHKIFDATPCLHNEHLSKKYASDIWIKREDLTPVRSYKIRGAINAMTRARAADPSLDMFVCASAGNHAQGVAFACKHFGVKGVIFMPVTTPKQKIEKTRTFGGDFVEIRMVGDYFDDTLASAKAFCDDEGAYFLSPFDDLDVITGQGSVAVEFMAQMDAAPDIVIVPVGGGGLSAGIVQYLQQVSQQTKIYFVEPEGAMSLAAAISTDKPVALASVDSFVDGAAVAKIGAMPFSALKDVDPDAVLASPENRLCATMLEMLNIEGIVLEPAGALALDALQDLQNEIRGKRVLCVASGGNFDFVRLPEVNERAQKYYDLKKYFILRIPQRPGALRDFLELLGEHDDIARFEYLKKSARNFGSVLIGIETNRPENFDALFKRMDGAGFVFQDITNDPAISDFVL